MAPRELIHVPVEIETERLVLHAPRAGCGQALSEAISASLPELQPWLPWVRQGVSPLDAEAEAIRAQARFITREDLRYHVILKETNTLIGGTGLHRIDWTVPKFEIGYWIDSRHTGNGYAVESARALTEFAFGQLKARRVEIRCDSLNGRSTAIPPKLGYELEATLRNFQRAFDDPTQIRDTLLFVKLG